MIDYGMRADHEAERRIDAAMAEAGLSLPPAKPTATPVPGALVVEPSSYDGDYFLTVDIDPDDPYGSFKALPEALEYEGRVYGKSAYDSDRNRAYYKAGIPVAAPARRK
jgi:hypothetical protein